MPCGRSCVQILHQGQSTQAIGSGRCGIFLIGYLSICTTSVLSDAEVVDAGLWGFDGGERLVMVFPSIR